MQVREVVLVGVPVHDLRRVEAAGSAASTAASRRGTRRCARRNSRSNAARRGRTTTSPRPDRPSTASTPLRPGARAHPRAAACLRRVRARRTCSPGQCAARRSPAVCRGAVSRARLRCGRRARAAPRGARGACRRRARPSRVRGAVSVRASMSCAARWYAFQCLRLAQSSGSTLKRLSGLRSRSAKRSSCSSRLTASQNLATITRCSASWRSNSLISS